MAASRSPAQLLHDLESAPAPATPTSVRSRHRSTERLLDLPALKACHAAWPVVVEALLTRLSLFNHIALCPNAS